MKTLQITSITEFKEPTKVEISSVECKSCRLVHSLDGDGNCEFCRRRLASPPKTTWELIKGLIFKDRESVLPPSVVSD